MLNINNYCCSGRLTRDAESRKSPDITTLSIAVDNSYKDKDGEWKNDAAFITVKVFGKSSERIAELTKGQPVYVEGRIKQENWEKDGVKHSKLVLNALSIKPFEAPRKGDSGDSSAGYKTQPRGYAESPVDEAADPNIDVPF